VTIYFAYGANMDPVAMAARCPGARRLGMAVLPEHTFRIAAEGYGTAMPSAGRAIPGVLWELTPQDERALDQFERVPEGLYRQEGARVEAEDGRQIEVMLYRAADSSPGSPTPGYLEGIIATAESLGLPEEYVESLRRLLVPSRVPGS